MKPDQRERALRLIELIEGTWIDSVNSDIVALLRELVAEVPLTDYGATHTDGCWAWGMKHYACALRRLNDLENSLDDVIGVYSRTDARREWWSGGTWLRPGDRVVVLHGITGDAK